VGKKKTLQDTKSAGLQPVEPPHNKTWLMIPQQKI